MFYNILYAYASEYPILNLFKYITFRSGGAFFVSFILGLIIIRYVIKFQKQQNNFQPIRTTGPDSHYSKIGTPTMGGIGIFFAFLITTFLWADYTNCYVLIVLFVTTIYSILGFSDDYLKIKYQNSQGVPGKIKLLSQFITAFIALYFIYNSANSTHNTHIALPFFKNIIIDLGIFYFIFTAIVIVGSSNAINLTDGLDGLVSIPIAICIFCLGIIAYLAGSSKFANYLHIIFIADSAELAVVCSAIIGSVLSFLWYNAAPAQIFMGDTGSLGLGGAVGTIAVAIKHEFTLAIIGGLFVLEAISVIIQVYYYKFTNGKRFFKMAPLHHHFEKCGWNETKIVTRFWIIAIIFAILGLSTLKIR